MVSLIEMMLVLVGFPLTAAVLSRRGTAIGFACYGGTLAICLIASAILSTYVSSFAGFAGTLISGGICCTIAANLPGREN